MINIFVVRKDLFFINVLFITFHYFLFFFHYFSLFFITSNTFPSASPFVVSSFPLTCGCSNCFKVFRRYSISSPRPEFRILQMQLKLVNANLNSKRLIFHVTSSLQTNICFYSIAFAFPENGTPIKILFSNIHPFIFKLKFSSSGISQ